MEKVGNKKNHLSVQNCWDYEMLAIHLSYWTHCCAVRAIAVLQLSRRCICMIWYEKKGFMVSVVSLFGLNGTETWSIFVEYSKTFLSVTWLSTIFFYSWLQVTVRVHACVWGGMEKCMPYHVVCSVKFRWQFFYKPLPIL